MEYEHCRLCLEERVQRLADGCYWICGHSLRTRAMMLAMHQGTGLASPTPVSMPGDSAVDFQSGEIKSMQYQLAQADRTEQMLILTRRSCEMELVRDGARAPVSEF